MNQFSGKIKAGQEFLFSKCDNHGDDLSNSADGIFTEYSPFTIFMWSDWFTNQNALIFIGVFMSFVWRGTNQNDRRNSNLNDIFRNDAAHAKVVKDYLIWIIVIEVGVGIGEQTEKSIRQWKKHWHNDVTMTSSLNEPVSVFTMIHSSST